MVFSVSTLPQLYLNLTFPSYSHYVWYEPPLSFVKY